MTNPFRPSLRRLPTPSTPKSTWPRPAAASEAGPPAAAADAPVSRGRFGRGSAPVLPETVSDPVEQAMAEASAAQPPLLALPRLLTPEDVAGILNIGERTLERWRCSGEGPRFVKLSRGTVRYTPEEVTSFIAERVKANTI